MAKYLGVHAVPWHVMIKSWWDKVLAGLLLSAIVLGSIYILYIAFKKLNIYWRTRHRFSKVPTAVVRYFADLESKTHRLSSHRESTKDPKSFSVFLGSFSDPPTPNQQRILSQWDLVILDPLRVGVSDALSQCTSAHRLGRLDVQTILQSQRSSSAAGLVHALDTVVQTLLSLIKRPQDTESNFTGVLLAQWQAHFPPVILNELIKHLDVIGLDVYLEVSGPTFLTPGEARLINMELIRGLVCRNGTILVNGDRRNFFQMAPMRPALRAFAAATTMRDSIVMMWDTINDDVELDHAVVKRSFTWCSFNSAISWIGPQAALTDANIATVKTQFDEPLGALMWLKEEETMKLQETWRLNDRISQGSRGDHTIYNSLHSFIPSLTDKLSLFPPKHTGRSESETTTLNDLQCPSQFATSRNSPFSFSPNGQDYTGLGCFQLGLDCSSRNFEQLVEQQRRLRNLGLLDQIKVQEIRDICAQLRALYDGSAWAGTPDEHRIVRELITLLSTHNGIKEDRIKVYVGLDSGFKTDLDTQFWGLYDVDSVAGVVHLYISAKTKDRTSTILHTFMSSRGCTRTQCLMAEVALSEQTGHLSERWNLPMRLVQDIEQLTPSETLLLLRRLALRNPEDSLALSDRVRSYCEYQLIEVPSLIELRALNATAYLRGEISAKDLILSRLSWYREQGCYCPDPDSALALFVAVDARVKEILTNGHSHLVSQIEAALREVLQRNAIDASADLFALSVFCAFRKLALNEVYLEVLDRNPLPNEHPDQAACFAEMFGLGSQCQAYFDMTPNIFGKVIADWQHAYYKANQPPTRDDMSTELPTAYASKQIDLDPSAGRLKLPLYYQVNFLGIFAVPALIDIMLLTTIGRGLYVTTYMTSTEKSMATTGLMVSLFLTGAIGTWISAGGSYYLHSMAYPAMNMFVLTRFIAGLAVCLFGGVLAFIIIGASKSWYAGMIFFFYFFLLSTYLTSLATLAIYQFPGFMFQSGRVVIACCLPILLISPIITLWVGHDALVYLCVLAGFVFSLLLGIRRVIAQWSTWYLKVPCVTDTEVVNWFMKTQGENLVLPEGVTDLAATPLPRRALQSAVIKEHNRRAWHKATNDEFVLKLAKGYSATMFLMDWYCKYSRTNMPYAYSPTWNLQCKAAIDTLRDMQKGLKLHNAFLHWRHAGPEVLCGILYFVIALLDKWVALISGGSIVGLNNGPTDTYRLAVGFGLAYYLIGAVFLDAVAQPLWAKANTTTPQPISSLASLRQVAINDKRAKRDLYFKNLLKFALLHVWSLSITSALMWSLENSRDATIMFIAYIGAYTGLLLYQYNRIFTGPLALKDLVVAAIVGLVTGIVLYHLAPRFAYSSVIALGAGTWTAAFLSFWTSGLRAPRPKDDKEYEVLKETPVYQSSNVLGPHYTLPQASLAEVFNSALALPEDMRYRLDPLAHPGIEVVENIRTPGNKSKVVQAAFGSAQQLLNKTTELWHSGQIVVDLVSARHVIQEDQKMRAISRTTGDSVYVFIFMGLDHVRDGWNLNIRRNCKVIAEALIQVTAESRLGYTHDHSKLAELLVVDVKGEQSLAIPEGVKRQLENAPAERAMIVKNGDKALLQYLLLGLDAEIDWDTLPRNIRTFLLKRSVSESCHASDEQLAWIYSRFCRDSLLDLGEYIARCNLGVTFTSIVTAYAEALEADPGNQESIKTEESSYDSCIELPIVSTTADSGMQLIDKAMLPIHRLYHAFKICIKFFVVALVADPEFQRELDYLLSGRLRIIRWPVAFILNAVWIFCKSMQRLFLPLFLFHGREKVWNLHTSMKGVKTIVKKNRIVIGSLEGQSTCFFTTESDGTIKLHQYFGEHIKMPKGQQQLLAINTYGDRLVLKQREEYARQSMVNLFTYEYPGHGPTSCKLPIQRKCIQGNLQGQLVQYDKRGYITSGSTIKDGNLMEFNYSYRKHAKFDDELLRAEYELAHISIKVSWSYPPTNHHGASKMNRWVPHSKVTEATFAQGSEVYHCKWDYDHKFHPVLSTTFNGEVVDAPPFIEHDWFGVLQKPRNTSFLSDNPIFSFKSIQPTLFSRLFRLNTQWYPISTARARTHLWKAWKEGKELDAVTTRWLDEIVLRRDSVLQPYWRARDLGRVRAAERYINQQADTIAARVDIDPEISSWTPLAYKIQDMAACGQGGDSRINTRSQSRQLHDTDSELHVLAMDTGTWPNEGGGVSACRRDMVNDLHTIRWHILAESANDFGVPKFQIERNVQSLTVLPLWGLDFLTPTHGIFEDSLDSAVQKKSHDTRDDDIMKRFVPILRTLVRCSRAIKLDNLLLAEAEKALLDLNDYFTGPQSSRHWSDVWKSKVVMKEWCKLWLSEEVENARPISEWLNAERPTLMHLENALDMWQRYFFIFSLPVPEKIPDVFQASHHFAGASYGVLCKLKRNCTLHVWDHCISWREVTVFLSSAMSFDPPFVCTSLMCLSRMTSVLILRNADVVLPCADFFNPGWEVELGTQEGTIEHRRRFARKIDPVVNGICNMEKFKPIDKIKSDKPTAVMLSHVRFVKDIKNAILASDIIVNKWGFTDYCLDIYGDMEKAPAYSVECKEIIASKGLTDNVKLRGLGSPSKVLEEAWLFLNSSISEGLPLAMGEAALTGVPVVCTDVGASFRVVTDPITWKKFSAVVAPNDAVSLAKAQINIMGLLDEWAEYADDAPGYRPKLSEKPTKEEVEMITRRMYEKTEQRRCLGMMGRDNVLTSFSSDRYLREHEQMLWIAKYQSHSYRARMEGMPISGSSSWTLQGDMSALTTKRNSTEWRNSSWSLAPNSNFNSALNSPALTALNSPALSKRNSRERLVR